MWFILDLHLKNFIRCSDICKIFYYIKVLAASRSFSLFLLCTFVIKVFCNISFFYIQFLSIFPDFRLLLRYSLWEISLSLSARVSEISFANRYWKLIDEAEALWINPALQCDGLIDQEDVVDLLWFLPSYILLSLVVFAWNSNEHSSIHPKYPFIFFAQEYIGTSSICMLTCQSKILFAEISKICSFLLKCFSCMCPATERL